MDRLEREQGAGRGADVKRQDAAQLDRQGVCVLAVKPLDEDRLEAATKGEVHGLFRLRAKLAREQA